MGWLLRLLLLGAMVSSSNGFAQTGTQERLPVFRVEVNILKMDVIVTDGEGNFVRGLEAEDFELFEDGRPREIQAFALVDLPDPLPAPTFADPGELDYPVVTNDGVDSGRLYVLVLDDLHVSFRRTERVRSMVRRFIETSLGPTDLVAVAFTSGRTRGFTADRNSLLSSVEQFMGKRLRSATLETFEALEGADNADQRPFAPPSEHERGQKALDALEVLRAHCRWLQQIDGRRKAILWVSEGLGYDAANIQERPYGDSILRELTRVLDEAARANVAIYSLNPGGLDGLAEDLIQIASGPAGPQASVGISESTLTRDTYETTDSSLGVGSLLTEQATAVSSLRRLSEFTGGFTVSNQNDFDANMDRIVQDNSHYYLIAFEPLEEGKPGDFRPIEVRVKRQGLRLRTRYGYAIAEESADPAPTAVELAPSPDLGKASLSPLPLTGLRLWAAATPLGEDAGKARVPVVIHGDTTTFGFREEAGHLLDLVEFSVTAIRPTGEVVDRRTNRVQLSVPTSFAEQVRQDGFRAMCLLELPPGSYRLLVVVHETGAERTGSLAIELELPEVKKGVLRGLALSSAMEARIPVAGHERDRARLPGAISPRRGFHRDDELIAYVEMAGSSDEELVLETLVLASDGTIESRIVSPQRPSKGKVTIVAQRLPLSGLAAGSYRLVIRALAPNGKAVASRRALFTVGE